jgi:hypothetical protein
MFKSFLRDRKLLLLFLIAFLVKMFSLNERWVEQYYSNGIYGPVSKTLRAVLGWIPFSVGDTIYIAAGIWLVLKVWKLLQLLKKRKAQEYLSWLLLQKYLKLTLLIYIVFNLFWGLNYYRQGIGKQLDITIAPYTVKDLFELTTLLQQRVNYHALKIDSVERLQYNNNTLLFSNSIAAYKMIGREYPFLHYANPSEKPSIFTPVGKFFGFTGYYNPFSGEAQLKTSIPVFLKPFVSTHEIAHQLGYAKENEASFVAYLACKSSGNINFLYSAYFEVYRDALFNCIKTGDTVFVNRLRKNLSPRVKYDIYDLRSYLVRNRNFIEPLMSGAYDKYLKMNNQPNGKATYNEVIAYLIAYMKKLGKDAI